MPNGTLMHFRNVHAAVDTFDQAKVRVSNKDGKLSLVIQVRVPRIGVVVFSFYISEDHQSGKLLWGTTTPVWPPRSGSERLAVVRDVRKVVRTFLSEVPQLAVDPDVSETVEDLGTYYDATHTAPPAPKRHKKRDKRRFGNKKPRNSGKSHRVTASNKGISAAAIGLRRPHSR